MTGEPIRPETTLSLAHLSPVKENPMNPDHTDPASSAVKPGLSSSEGKIAMIVAVVTVLGPIITALAGAMPDNPWAQVALSIVAGLISLFVALGWMKKRSDLKEDANRVAGDLAHGNKAAETALALADKAISIAKDHPELARDLLKSAGISVPTPPA